MLETTQECKIVNDIVQGKSYSRDKRKIEKSKLSKK